MEKPNMEAAKKIATSGALWNTLVIVSRCGTLMEAMQCTTPQLYRAFQPVLHAIGIPDGQGVLERVYRELRPVSFSTDVLEALPFERRQALLVKRVEGGRWSDWGTEDRLRRTLDKMSDAMGTESFLQGRSSGAQKS